MDMLGHWSPTKDANQTAHLSHAHVFSMRAEPEDKIGTSMPRFLTEQRQCTERLHQVRMQQGCCCQADRHGHASCLETSPALPNQHQIASPNHFLPRDQASSPDIGRFREVKRFVERGTELVVNELTIGIGPGIKCPPGNDTQDKPAFVVFIAQMVVGRRWPLHA